MCRCALVFFAILAAFVLSVDGQAVQVTSDWSKFQTKNFTVISNAEPARLKETAVRLEQFRFAVHKALGIQQKDQTDTRVVIFRDAASFRPFKPKRSDGSSDDLVSGQFHAGTDANYISAADDDKQFSSVFHEYVHDVLARNYRQSDLPVWLNEGLAEYFQAFRSTNDSIEFGTPENVHLSILRKRPLIPWDVFFAKNELALQQSSDDQRLAFYAQAWALVNILVGNTRVGEGSQVSISPGSLLQRVLSTPPNELTEKNAKFIASHSNYPPVKFPRIATAIEIRELPLSEAETDAYLGDLAFRVRDFELAESYLYRALSKAPNLSFANASLGLVRLHQRRFADSRGLLEKAILADSENFLVYYYSAFLTSRGYTDEIGLMSRIPPDKAKKMREHLRRSIALNPLYPESYKLVAIASLVNGDETEAALTAIRKAVEIRPADPEYRLIEAQILLRLDRLTDARNLAASVIATTRDAYIRKEAEQVIQSVDAYAKARSESERVFVSVFDTTEQRPLILQYKDLTEDEVARIEMDRQINNLNRLIDRPTGNERQAVGRIERIKCVNGSEEYLVRTEDRTLHLAGNGFDRLKVRILLEGTHSLTFGCDAGFRKVLASVIYRPYERAGNVDGRIVSVTFVPEYFRLKPLEDVVRERLVIIEGRKPTDLSANRKAIEAEQTGLEQQMRETQLRNIEARLREPTDGERRVIGVPERLECVLGKLVLHARSENVLLRFETISEKLEVRSFTPETGILELGCRTSLPPLPAVLTYRNDPLSADIRELISIEFVPRAFRFN